MFDFSNLSMVSPWVILGVGIMATMLASSVRIETKLPAKLLTILTLILVMVSSFHLFSQDTKVVLSGLIEISPLTCITLFFISGISLFFVIGSTGYLNKEKILEFSDKIVNSVIAKQKFDSKQQNHVGNKEKFSNFLNVYINPCEDLLYLFKRLVRYILIIGWRNSIYWTGYEKRVHTCFPNAFR